MKNKTCGICNKEFPSMWKAKTRDKPQMCRQCALKGSVQIGDLKISNKTFSEPTTNKEYKSIPELLKLATMVFNKWIRNRDISYGWGKCISCGEDKYHYDLQAGHYMPSTYSELRFNELNVWIECEKCNCIDDKHLIGYRKNLIDKIGLEKVEWLESHKIASDYKWKREELLDIIKKYK